MSSNWRDPKKEDYKLPSTENELSKVRQTIEHKSSFWSFNKKVVLRTILIGANILLILFVIVEYTQRHFTGVSNENDKIKFNELSQQLKDKDEEINTLKKENEQLKAALPEEEIKPKVSDSRIALVDTIAANIRFGPSANAKIVAIANRGDTLEVLSKVKNLSEVNWLLVRYKGKEGYVKSLLVK